MWPSWYNSFASAFAWGNTNFLMSSTSRVTPVPSSLSSVACPMSMAMRAASPRSPSMMVLRLRSLFSGSDDCHFTIVLNSHSWNFPGVPSYTNAPPRVSWLMVAPSYRRLCPAICQSVLAEDQRRLSRSGFAWPVLRSSVLWQVSPGPRIYHTQSNAKLWRSATSMK